MVQERKSGGGYWLLAELRKKGMTQSDLARLFGITAGAVSRWASGDRSPCLRLALRLERELGIPVEYWLDGGPAHESSQ